MRNEKPLVDKVYQLKKVAGKGGWTYVAIPEIPQDKRAKFGWVKVKGKIDSFELKEYKLMPMGDGRLFLPVRAGIRKAIKKQEGDKVHVVLFEDTSTYKIPKQIRECFELEPQYVYENFCSFTEGQQKSYVDWIYEAKRAETRAQRIATMMERVSKGKRLHDTDKTG